MDFRTSDSSGLVAIVLTAAVVVTSSRLVASDFIYWSTHSEIVQSSVERTDRDVIFSSTQHGDLGRVVVSEQLGSIFWIANSGRQAQVFRADLDGANVRVVLKPSEQVWIRGLHIDHAGGKLYFCGSKIWCADLDGSEEEEAVDAWADDVVVDSDANQLFWSNSDGIWRSALDGSCIEAIWDRSIGAGISIALNPGHDKIYWAISDRTDTLDGLRGQVVARSSRDGSEYEELVAIDPILDDYPSYLSIDVPGTRIYWTNGENSRVYTSDLDGNDVRLLFTEEDGIVTGLSVRPDVESRFERGDTNDDGIIDLSDCVFVLGFLFQGGAEPSCLDASDINNDGDVDVADAIYLFGYLFRGADSPPEPVRGCGRDPTSSDALGCASHTSCDSAPA